MSRIRWSLALPVCLVALAVARGEEITPKGQQLAAALDQLPVKDHWLPGYLVEWESGKSRTKATDDKPHTHCSAFAAAAAKKFGIYLLRPAGADDPEGVKGHSATQLANAQFDWLQSEEGEKLGWRPVKTAVEAQQLANQGRFVVAAFKEDRADRHGHIAVVRPSGRDEKSVEKDGPEIIQAGMTNYADATLREGFEHHPQAWKTDRKVRFFSNVHAPKLP